MKKRLMFYLTIILLFSTVSSISAPIASAEGKSATKEYKIYPDPHSIEYNKGTLSLKDEVQVIYDDTIDEITKEKVEKVFTNNDLEAPAVATEPAKDKTNLWIGTKGSKGPVDRFAAENIGSEGMVFDKTDAYQLEMKDNNIVILGNETDASFYGAVTLETMLAQSPQKEMRNVSIKDFANTEIRGFIEYCKVNKINVGKDKFPTFTQYLHSFCPIIRPTAVIIISL